MWTNCIFTAGSWLGAYQEIQPGYIQPGDSAETNNANRYQWDNQTVYDLVEASRSLEQDFRAVL